MMAAPYDVICDALRPDLASGILEDRARRVTQKLGDAGFVIRPDDADGIAEAERAELIAALDGMLAEWDKFTRYGSPIAKASNERVNAARAAFAKAAAR